MEKILQVGVKVLLQNKEGKYLVLFRNIKNNPQAGAHWDMPGGRITPGTSLFENLKREVREETGLELDSDIKLITVQDIIPTDRHVVRVTYSGFADGEVMLSKEHSEYKWLSLEEIKNLEPIDVYFKQVLEKFLI